jgi:PAS domain S-box-containing protein
VTDRLPIGQRLARGDPAMLGQLFEVLAEAVTVRDLNGEIVFANRAALTYLGFDSLEALRRTGTPSIMDDYYVEDEHGAPLGHQDVPSVRLIAGDPVAPLLMRVVHRVSGDLRWILLKTSPLRHDDGSLAGAITVIEDVTAVKTAELQTQVLAESGRILASSLDYEQTLRNIVAVAVPSLADYCAVDLVDDSRRLQRVAAAHRDAGRSELIGQLSEIPADILDLGNPAARVVLTGESTLFEHFGAPELAKIARDAAHAGMLRELELRSMMIVPMRVPTRTIGVMTLATVSQGRRLDPGDLDLAEQLARRAGVAVDNSRLHTKLTSVAETLQQSLLPREPPSIRGWEIATLYRPTETELRIDVGGDFYEFFEHDGTWFLIVGDVGGKGVDAASLTALMRHGARVASRSEPQPAAILRRLDEALVQQPGDTLCTALCLCLHPDHLVLSSAGHPPAILVSATGELREAPTPGPLLGAFPDSSRPEEYVELRHGELLVIYTDGVIEAPGREERFGVERLRALLEAHAGSDPRALLGRLDAALDAFSLAPARDDIAVLALRRA